MAFGKGQKKHFQIQSSGIDMYLDGSVIACWSLPWLQSSAFLVRMTLGSRHKPVFPVPWSYGMATKRSSFMVGLVHPVGCSNSDPLPMVPPGSPDSMKDGAMLGWQLGAAQLGDICSGWPYSLPWDWVSQHPCADAVAVAVQWHAG